MCYEFDLEYWQYRLEDARNAMQEAEQQMKKPKPAAPATPGTPETAVEEREPVPA